MKWKEPTFGATPMLKALTAASARKKAKSFDLVAEQKKQKLTYPDWAQDWMRKYKEAWYIAKANGDEVGMRKAQAGRRPPLEATGNGQYAEVGTGTDEEADPALDGGAGYG